MTNNSLPSNEGTVKAAAEARRRESSDVELLTPTAIATMPIPSLLFLASSSSIRSFEPLDHAAPTASRGTTSHNNNKAKLDAVLDILDEVLDIISDSEVEDDYASSNPGVRHHHSSQSHQRQRKQDQRRQ